ncbi:multicopper oxidase domain-containing protein [Alicyclobacillus macrosporangiidus]|uniref:multicopper oxidase domain-containing protein n=1 Tax=Alicyclobacillus macrosporangiidus TaxID=392015 RepID=UPI0034E98AE5
MTIDSCGGQRRFGGFARLPPAAWSCKASEGNHPSHHSIPWNGTVKSVVFNLSRGDVTLRDGRRFSGYLINGQFPGPEIRVREGDKVRVMVNNHLDRPTTLHWHGVNVPSPMDGVPGISMSPGPHPLADPLLRDRGGQRLTSAPTA